MSPPCVSTSCRKTELLTHAHIQNFSEKFPGPVKFGIHDQAVEGPAFPTAAWRWMWNKAHHLCVTRNNQILSSNQPINSSSCYYSAAFSVAPCSLFSNQARYLVDTRCQPASCTWTESRKKSRRGTINNGGEDSGSSFPFSLSVGSDVACCGKNQATAAASQEIKNVSRGFPGKMSVLCPEAPSPEKKITLSAVKTLNRRWLKVISSVLKRRLADWNQGGSTHLSP